MGGGGKLTKQDDAAERLFRLVSPYLTPLILGPSDRCTLAGGHGENGLTFRRSAYGHHLVTWNIQVAAGNGADLVGNKGKIW